MAKQQFTLWLKNFAPGHPQYWGEGGMYALGNNLLEYFNPICAKTAAFEPEARFSYEPAAGKLQDHELLVYILPSARKSIVLDVSAKENNPQQLGPSGSTYPAITGVISEVYLDVMQGDGDLPRLAANLIFHEWMHNKLDAFRSGGPLSDVHAQGGGGLAVSTPIKAFHRPSPRNLALMTQHLARSHPQFTPSLAKVSPYP